MKNIKTQIVLLFIGFNLLVTNMPVSEGNISLQDTIKTDNATYVNILQPVLAVPTIQEKTGFFMIHVESDAGNNSSWNITITTDYDAFFLSINNISHNNDIWNLNVSFPLDVREDLYDLIVRVDDINDTEPHAVYVTDSFKDQFTFIQITDIHLGASGTENNFKECIQELNLIHPEFVLITGDITEDGTVAQYNSFVNCLLDLDVPTYIINGNHEYDGSISSYHQIVNPYPDFSFDYGQYHFIGLDSGDNCAPYGLPGCMMGTGLADAQISWLENDLNTHSNSKQTFTFMHHTALDPDKCPAWGFDWTSTISQNQQEFLDICENHNVSMVLCGHTHIDEVWDRNGVKQTGGTIDDPLMPLYIQTRTTCKEDNLGYRIIQVNGSNVDSYTYDGDGNGVRDAATSTPLDKLSVTYSPSNDGTSNVVTASIVNQLRENLTNIFLRFNMPKSIAPPTITNGGIEQKIEAVAFDTYYVYANISPLSSKDVTLRLINLPKASFTHSSPSYTILDTIQFTDMSKDFDGEIVSWLWDFGDGSNSNEQNPAHNYSLSGTYTVKLTVIDNDEEQNTVTHEIVINNIAPLANFTYTPTAPVTNATVNFTDNSIDCDGEITAWYWEFGDGYTSTDRNPEHKYAIARIYTINLSVTDDCWRVNITSKTVSVAESDIGQGSSEEPAEEKEEKGFIPAFEVSAFLVAMIGICIILLRKRRR